MAAVFIGDLQFTNMVGSESFRRRFTLSFSVNQVSSMSTLNDYKVLLPGEAQILVVGCLPALLSNLTSSLGEHRELTLSK